MIFGFKTNAERGLERFIYPDFAQLNLELGSSDPKPKFLVTKFYSLR